MSWLVQNAVLATAAALVLAAALRRWRPAPVVEHLLWLALAVKFVLPPLARVPVPLPVEAPAPAAVVLLARPAASGAEGGVAAAQPRSALEPLRASGGGAPPGAAATPSRRTAGEMLALVWLAGGVLTALRMAWWWLRWRRARRLGPAPPEFVALVDDVAVAMGVRSPAVALDATLPAPVVTGLVRPRLLWPARLLGALPEARTRAVVAHELAHLRRGDLWSGVVELVAGVVWWWYPGWHLVRRRMKDAAERACDAAVVRRFPEARRAYAEALLDVAAHGAAGAHPVLALGVDGPGPLRRRLREILGPTARPPSRTARVAVLLTALVILPAWATALPRPQADIVAALARAAADPAPAVRRVAANGLRDIGGAAANAVLQRLLDDPDEHVRRVARVGLGIEAPAPNKVFPEGRRPSPPPEDTLAAVLARLSDNDDQTRLRAAWRLGNLRDARAVDALVAALRDADFHVRQAAADALGNVGDRRATTALIAALRDAHPRVRQSAASALGNLGAADAAAHLVPLLSDADANVRRAVAYAVGHTGGAPHVSALGATLDDADEHVRMAAASALGAIGRGRTP